jgi:hypothetical protein
MQRKKISSAHEAFAVIKTCVLKAVGKSYHDIVNRTAHDCICVQSKQGIYKYNVGQRCATS